MKILVVSDTHRQHENYFEVVEKELPIDLLIHCGDIEGSNQELFGNLDCKVIIVAGNNDFFTANPKEVEFEIGKYKVLLSHGHTYNIAIDNHYMKQEAKERGANMIIYGHTHKPVVDFSDEVVAINPGSLSYPRQEGRQPSYIVMNVEKTGEVSAKIKYI